ncbi:MAG: hypothetical protein ACM3SO_02615 [Betaproteobacteria bacterium]
MRIKLIVTAAAVAAVSAGFAANAQTYNEPITPIPGERIYVQPMNQPSGPIHGGYVTYADEALLSDAIGALSSDRRMDGSIVTIVASNGNLFVDGTTVDGAQASRIETKLKHLAGVSRVFAWFETAGA